MKTRISVVLFMFAITIWSWPDVSLSAGTLLTYELTVSKSVRAGDEAEIVVIFDIKDPWYVYAPTGANVAQGMTETSLQFEPHEYVQFSAPKYPVFVRRSSFHVFEGSDIRVVQSVRIRPRTAPGTYPVRGTLEYQLCKIDTCLPPMRDDILITIDVE